MNKLNKQLTVCILLGVLCVITLSLTGCRKEPEPIKPAKPTVGTMIDSAKDTVNTVNAAALEQKLCPVMAGEINKELFTEYKGKKVYFCCDGCKGKFEADPEKFLTKLPQFKK